MTRATCAEVFWEDGKKAWVVRVQVGEEAVRRTCKGVKRDADDDALRSLALQTARDEGYDLATGDVRVKR
ncbi:MAG: hypothetical protein HXY18_09400 [Bryobacteraceae bacterium]|nr:hypothetical protein [Bryobacteraceae bacterium]